MSETDRRIDDMGKADHRGKATVTITVDREVLAAADAAAEAAGLDRSALVERALRNDQLRAELAAYTRHTVPAFEIDTYAERIYQTNRAAGL